MNATPSRRTLLGAVGLAALAGCVGGEPASTPRDGESADGDATEPPGSSSDDASDPADGPPIADEPYHLPYGIEELRGHAIETDARIPTIDEPVFTDADGIADDPVELEGDDVVFGVERDGVARAYPQRILVYHEIVNDELAGDPVAITYCPLTGTAQGFERGDVEFAVSGWLLNSNLVMSEGTGTWWPQLPATGLDEPFAGDALSEFRLIWTSWDRWLERYPETEVLTSRTGYERRYHDDPYGGYAPRRAYYDYGGPMYDVAAEPGADSPLEEKSVVLGCRTAEGAIAFEKESLLEERILRGELAGVEHVAVADPALATGYVYENADGRTVEADGDGTYLVDGEAFEPAELPLDRRLAFDSMWFAWYAYYPGTELRL